MSFNNILSIFLPKDVVFFGLFENVAENIQIMGAQFRLFVEESDPIKRLEIFKQIEELEHQNDEITHKIFYELGKNFITPFDREDIHYLATSTDDVADYIFASCKRIHFHNIDPNKQAIQSLAQLVFEGSQEVSKLLMQLRGLKKPQKIMESIIKINSLENEADDLFDKNIKELFDTENDFKTLIRLREVYTLMEVTTDKFEDVSNVVETIIVKYA
jgi:predicted phosphate transport protein (TIGR00153 family)